VKSEHFCDTPARVARFYREFTAGRGAQPADILKTFPSTSKDLVIVSHVNFFSLCPHHLLPYSGTLHFAYVPDELIVGLSKVPRLVHALSRRLVVQEALVSDIADAFMIAVKPLGCAVKAIGRHSCIAARGVRCPSVRIIAVARRGIFENNASLCRDFDKAIAHGSKRHRATASQE
jgi:GTP cyclohydrolase I